MLAYEDLIAPPDVQMWAALARFDINEGALPSGGYRNLLQPPRPVRWADYADESWFAEIESRCEDELRRFCQTG